MKLLIRITGCVDKDRDVAETLDRLRLKRKYACSIVDDDKKEIKGMIQKVRNFIAYGDVDEKTLIELIEKRGQLLDKTKKLDAGKIAKEIMKNKSMKDLEIKPFFRLHPARGGINSKSHFPKGVLGNHKEKINDLVKRMLWCFK